MTKTFYTHRNQTTLPSITPSKSGCIVTIGNFDGCHLGHQSLISSAQTLARLATKSPTGALATMALSFAPRPEAFFRGRDEALLFTEAQKTLAFEELGLDGQIIQSFDKEFSQLTHQEFYHSYLRQGLAAVGLVVGENFRFGQERGGDIHYLRAQSQIDGMQLHIGSAAQAGSLPISSTRIRQTLSQNGNVEEAAAMLGRPFMLEGTIKRGDQLGRQLGVPTANLEEVTQILPAFGVYAGFVFIPSNGGERIAVTKMPAAAIPTVFSLGIRPTLGQTAPATRIEAHLLEGNYALDELYGKRAGYYFTHRLRGEERFPSLEALKIQMQWDIEEAKRLLAIHRASGV